MCLPANGSAFNVYQGVTVCFHCMTATFQTFSRHHKNPQKHLPSAIRHVYQLN